MFYQDESKVYGLEVNIANLTAVNVGEAKNNNVTLATNATWANYDPEACQAPTEDFITSAIFLSCVYVMYSAIFVVALVGNGLVCFVVHSSPRMKTVTNYFIVNLAVGDILMTVFCVPFTFVSTLALRYWPFGGPMCKVVNYSQAVSVFVSAYTLLAISIDRYIVIMRPLRPRLGKAQARMVVAAVWGGALATAAPILVVSELKRPSEWHEYCRADVCLENWQKPEQFEQYTCALLLLQFALPLCALVGTYARIASAVWGGRPPGEAQTVRDSRMQRSKRKMIKMMVAVVVVFTVCWLPINIFIVLWTIYGVDDAWATWSGTPYVWFACHWLAMSHSCYNPIIYCYMNTRYRRGFKQADQSVPWPQHPARRVATLFLGGPILPLGITSRTAKLVTPTMDFAAFNHSNTEQLLRHRQPPSQSQHGSLSARTRASWFPGTSAASSLVSTHLDAPQTWSQHQHLQGLQHPPLSEYHSSSHTCSPLHTCSPHRHATLQHHALHDDTSPTSLAYGIDLRSRGGVQ